jgi:DNA mismatch endonuclease (patch repair protein)
VPERWVSTAAGRHLRGRPKTGTRPEVELRRALRRLGVGYRVQHKIARGCTPDISLLGARIAVFVDGCFWHGCPEHGTTSFRGPNADLWVEKLAHNRDRDIRSTQLARAAGWQVVRLWECEVLSAADELGVRLRQLRDSARVSK